ncbi:Arginine, lysine or ornithine decarboxylase [Anaerovibrio sp. JC8]|uniref:aminotransferase class I/II-fold pyridoxal phosphate-dependent enzyme n=1 Tax=Anaerovibrio sp. JC8 TaxID=1240085 RepID=UPI000A0E4104|nr:aminotransferase class I/II-fold pyridoxal phosphate-dependent enzyme [Anaerovibrio sp. JC8]ORT99348.1 Arginine, lysine or ornithine decarboxylase [Anaerovibrio sp. JC8]
MYKDTNSNNLQINQNEAPISEAMDKYARDGALAFHTPGHKQGLGAHDRLKRLITEEGLRQEVSLMEELDDLHDPSGCIKEAEALAARLWGAKDTLFMINGTTGAIHAMIMGTLSPGDRVLVPRNAHRSIIGGIILAGAVPIYIEPEIIEALGIAGVLTADTVAAAVQAHPEARALIAVYPTYYGMAGDLEAIATILHDHNMLLLVDEAHGAHLKFAESLEVMPRQALDLGADVVAQSTHKVLGSMTQTSMLHIGSDRVSGARIREAAALLQSTSPNQLLLASLDIARLQMATEGRNRLERAVQLSEWLRREINKIEGLYCVGEEILDNTTTKWLDRTRITVNLTGIGLPGPEAELILRHQYKVQCELSDNNNLLFIISMADTEETARRLLEVLKLLAEDHGGEAMESAVVPRDLFTTNEVAVSPREAFYASREKIRLCDAVGCVAAETVAFYPPGVPVLCPGEVIRAELIEAIQKQRAAGMRVVGPSDSTLKYIEVVKE